MGSFAATSQISSPRTSVNCDATSDTTSISTNDPADSEEFAQDQQQQEQEQQQQQWQWQQHTEQRQQPIEERLQHTEQQHHIHRRSLLIYCPYCNELQPPFIPSNELIPLRAWDAETPPMDADDGAAVEPCEQDDESLFPAISDTCRYSCAPMVGPPAVSTRCRCHSPTPQVQHNHHLCFVKAASKPQQMSYTPPHSCRPSGTDLRPSCDDDDSPAGIPQWEGAASDAPPHLPLCNTNIWCLDKYRHLFVKVLGTFARTGDGVAATAALNEVIYAQPRLAAMAQFNYLVACLIGQFNKRLRPMVGAAAMNCHNIKHNNNNNIKHNNKNNLNNIKHNNHNNIKHNNNHNTTNKNTKNNNNSTYSTLKPQQQQQQQQQQDNRNYNRRQHCQSNKRLAYANTHSPRCTSPYLSSSSSSSSSPSSSTIRISSNKLYETAESVEHPVATASALQAFGHNYYNLLRRSISLYTASGFLLVLCCLTTSVSRTFADEPPSFDKHPIQVLDWSKFDESSSDKEILDLLLEKTRYDKRLLPPVNELESRLGTLTVNVNVLLLSLASPDESSLKYEVEFLLNQQWNDPRLQYGNKSHYDFLNALHHHDSIWTPDTYFIMHGDFKHPIIPMHFALRIYRNGTITYAMRRHLILSCQGSLHIFPFDDPKCSFSMESISYEEAQIKYVWKNDEDTLRKSPSLTTLNAYLIKNQTTACDQNSWRGNYSCLRVDLIFTRDRAFYFTTVFIPGIILVTSSFITFWLEWNAVPARSMIGNYSCLQVELTFTRDRAYYFTTVFIPGIILVTSSFITFWLEWNAVPARVMIGVTTMLNFFTTSNGFRSTLPVVSNLTAMNVWDGVCMCFIYASLLEFVCVNYVGRKRPLHNVVYRPGENPVTQRLPAVLSRIGVILASPLEVIEREFHAALSSEKVGSTNISATTTRTSSPLTTSPTELQWEDQRGRSLIRSAIQNRQWRSLRRPTSRPGVLPTQAGEPVYAEPVFTPINPQITQTPPSPALAVKLPAASEPPSSNGLDTVDNAVVCLPPLAPPTATEPISDPQEFRPRSHSVSTNTPQLLLVHRKTDGVRDLTAMAGLPDVPQKPPRRKHSRSTSPAGAYAECTMAALGGGGGRVIITSDTANVAVNGEKRRDAGIPNEIVACTTCGGSNSPCTHSANNGCATESCFVQVRKKEPPHPIRVAKTIDVIARITFPTAYAIFLIFFFVHYKGFS